MEFSFMAFTDQILQVIGRVASIAFLLLILVLAVNGTFLVLRKSDREVDEEEQSDTA